MKMDIAVFIIALMLVSCGSTPAKIDKIQQDTSEETLPSSIGTNTFNGIFVDMIGTPYGYKDICGNCSLDYLIEADYRVISTGQSSSFINFTIDKFVF